jgi:NAD(P)H-nitrite reductase large subunit
MKVTIGFVDAERKLECIVRTDIEQCTYCKITFKEEKIVGCILLGETKARAEILNAIERKFDVKALKDSILKAGFDFKKLKES